MIQPNAVSRPIVEAPRQLGLFPRKPRMPWKSETRARKEPAAWCDQLSKRAESMHEMVTGTDVAPSTFYVDDLHVGEVAVLSLHGDLTSASVPQLESVLEGLVVLRLTCLVVDLSGVTHVSADALDTILWHATTNAGVVLRSPDRETRSEVQRRGHARWIESNLVAK